VYISFDVDSLDSLPAKGTGTPVELGLDVMKPLLCRACSKMTGGCASDGGEVA
jgi:arginase family enzyme